MTQPLRVDTAALKGAARELAAISDELGDSLTHEWQPPANQPSAKATVAVTAATNHVMSECSANLLTFADNIAQAARYYDATDSAGARTVINSMNPPK
ncbi:type VII secretion target [Mycobacterium sp. URHD0025]|uniref:type VII secretion target n=1 Tax=Mycobacterium sp. URHD0025 TaxID=1298864 RepID=UPI0003FED999|nr:type VII secretion target [Mycobacterium sp. URHD0025]